MQIIKIHSHIETVNTPSTNNILPNSVHFIFLTEKVYSLLF